MHQHHRPSAVLRTETANDRLKRASERWLPQSVVLAVVVHVAVFTFWPDMTAGVDARTRDVQTIVIPPALELPPPPEKIARPAAPVIANFDIATDDVMPPTTFDAWSAEQLAPPVRMETKESSDFEAFIPSMVAPRVLNAQEVERELLRNYPSILRDAGVGGQVDVNLWLDESGAIVRAELGRTSGYDALDEAALRVVRVMRLTPAENRGRPVRVIVMVPVRFTVR